MMTRYEFAAIVYRLMEKGLGHTDPEMNRLAREFSNELSYIRIDTIHQETATLILKKALSSCDSAFLSIQLYNTYVIINKKQRLCVWRGR